MEWALTSVVPMAIVVTVATRGSANWPIALGAGLAMAAALILRHRHPVVAVVLASAAQVTLVWFDVAAVGAVGVVIVLFAASSRLQLPLLIVMSACSLLVLGTVEFAFARERGEDPEVVPVALVFVLGVAGGLAWRYYRSAVTARADESAALARSEAAEQRVALSRELHDALGHQLAVINVQSQVAARVLSTDAEAAAAALGHVRGATRAALAELGELVGRLRDADSPLSPPDLDSLRDGFATGRHTGTFDVDLDGAPALSELAQRTVYRVIQEGLTNVGLHAGDASVQVWARRRGTVVEVRVTNQAGPGRTSAGRAGRSGHGLAGLSERVEGLGGSFRAGPRADGGFTVEARIPIEAGR